MGGQTVLLVGASINQIQRFIEQMKKRNLCIIILETSAFIDQHLRTLAAIDQFIEVSDKDISTIQAWLETKPLLPQIDYILTFSEFTVEATAAIAEYLSIPWNSPHAIHTIRDKLLLRNKLRDAGIVQPNIAACSCIADVKNFITNAPNNGPWIIKPRIGTGSEGVSIIEKPEDIPKAIERLTQKNTQSFLIEEFIHGKEYSVEGVFIAKEAQFFAVTEKMLMDNGLFLECGHLMPAPIAKELGLKIYAAVRQALKAVGLEYGLFHVELWVEDEQITLGEIHARPGGMYINWLSELVTNIETYGILIDDQSNVLSLAPSLWPSNSYHFFKAAGITYFQVEPGTVSHVSAPALIEQNPNCIKLHYPLKLGDRIPPTLSWKDLEALGYVIVTGKDTEEVRILSQKIQQELRIVTKA